VNPTRLCLVHDTTLPVYRYGGAERALGWLAKGLREAGHEVLIACRRGSSFPGIPVVGIDFTKPIAGQLPPAALYHLFFTPREKLSAPYVVTIQGNGKPGEEFARNTVFISRNHAERHGAQAYVHNGLDPAEYAFSEKKDKDLLFLAKASWSVKNVKGAIRLAKKKKRPLQILGGNHWLAPVHRRQGIHWRGMVGGEEKNTLVARSAGLLFPVLWHEPFGIAVIEALVSGTPALVSPFGSLPELVPDHVGRVCESEMEFLDAIDDLSEFSPRECRDWVLENFDYRGMTQKYEECYEKFLSGENLNATKPAAKYSPEVGCVLPQ
jgi:glycosyltransferase involved in cell wall biosynthesis